MRSVSKRGAIINGDVLTAQTLLDRGMKSPNAEEFVQDAEVVLVALADAVHAGVDPGPDLQTQTRGFMAFSRQFSEGALGVASRRSGLATDEVAALLVSGQWDPFADVEMP
jgi:hypothetical protein